jgi:hypothetical protein
LNPAALRTMRLLRLPQPFDRFDFLYKVKFDGLLALAHCERPSLPNGVRFQNSNRRPR